MHEGFGEVHDGATTDGDPVDMQGVWGASDSGVQGVANIVEVAGSKADVQSIFWTGVVGLHAGGTHLGERLGGEVHALHESDFSGG